MEKKKQFHIALEIYINHLEKLQEDFKVRFKDLVEMNVPGRIVTPFGLKMEN